ncbi:MAG TPA: BadF/BadG/BcrA/BcrD ATPase family protein [Candidatus Acidoferrum sp.]|jgi:N-acetylglucosamine kinase-like BadF-type ATPase
MHYVLGFDGGGTKTECVLLDSQRQIRATTRSGPSNPFRIGHEAATTALAEAAQSAAREAGIELRQITALCAGLAGVGSSQSHEEMQEQIANAFPNTKIRLITDLELSLESISQPAAIVLVAGTGSSALGRDADGHTARAGGHGPLLSDQGSAFDVGRLAVAAAVRERDRTHADSVIGAQILRHLKFSSWTELRDRARTAADEVFPRVFPVVAQAAESGDEHSQTLLRNAAHEIALLAEALVDRLKLRDSAIYIAKTGGMVSASRFFDAQLDVELKKIAPQATIGLSPVPPAEAAAGLALDLISSNSNPAARQSIGK